MKIGILTRNINSWSSTQLREALVSRGVKPVSFSFPDLLAQIACKPYLKGNGLKVLEDLDALFVRPIGRGSLEELVFRMDILYRLERLGLCVINPPEAIEHCVDKYDILAILEDKGIPVPRTAITENTNEALKAFDDLGGDVVVKPIFGSRGVGVTRIVDPEIALTVFKAIRYHHGVIYIQQFIDHGHSDIRALFVGDRVVAAMRRVAQNWKTNYSQGAQPKSLSLDPALEDLAIKSAKSVGCKVAGVDILESSMGPMIVDVNSQPGWKGLQEVSKTKIADEIVSFILSESKK